MAGPSFSDADSASGRTRSFATSTRPLDFLKPTVPSSVPPAPADSSPAHRRHGLFPVTTLDKSGCICIVRRSRLFLRCPHPTFPTHPPPTALRRGRLFLKRWVVSVFLGLA